MLIWNTKLAFENHGPWQENKAIGSKKCQPALTKIIFKPVYKNLLFWICHKQIEKFSPIYFTPIGTLLDQTFSLARERYIPLHPDQEQLSKQPCSSFPSCSLLGSRSCHRRTKSCPGWLHKLSQFLFLRQNHLPNEFFSQSLPRPKYEMHLT